MNKYLKEILKKQCQIVKADYNKMNFKKENWFLDYEWTEIEQDKFIDWLVEYMKKNKEARNSLMSIPSTNKRFLEKFANGFVLNYGWRTKK